MRIAMMTNNYKPFVGGVPISIEHLSEGLRKRGHEVCIFAPEYGENSGEQWEPGVVRYRSCKKRLKNGMVIPDVRDPGIREEFERRQFDLIHVHQPMLIGNLAEYLKKKYRIPLVYTYHTRYEEYLHYLAGGCTECGKIFLPWYLASYLRKCDLVLAPSEGLRHDLRWYPMDTPVKVLPTGLDDRAYEKDEIRAGEIRELYLGHNSDGSSGAGKYLFITVSRLEKEKNLYFLLRCVRQMKESLGTDFRVLLVGEGAERPALERYANDLGLADEVVFIGAVANWEVRDYLSASDVFLFASKSETQGIVLAEAMAEGLPVIAVSACGPDDIVRNGFNGYLTRESEETFAECVRQVVSGTDRIEALRTGARLTAEDYRIDSIAERAEMGYQFALEKKRREANGTDICEKKCAESSFLRLFKTS